MNEITPSEISSARAFIGVNPTFGRQKLGKHLGVSEDRAGRILKKIRTEAQGCEAVFGGQPDFLFEPTSRIQEDIDDKTWRISASQVRIKSIEELIDEFKVDTRVWRVKKFTCVSHEQAQAPRPVGSTETGWAISDPKAMIIPLYNVRAEFERMPEMDATIKIIESLKKDIENLEYRAFTDINPNWKSVSLKPEPSPGRCLEVSIPDVHFGKLAWAPETGWESYDLQIAKKIWKMALTDLLGRANGNIEKIWFVLGNDLIHFDNKQWATTRGTLQDGDSRFHKVFSQVQTLMIESVEDMLRLAPVEVITIPGNHDEHAAWHMGNSLKMAFRGFKHVDVDDSPNPRKYAQFGKNMLCWDHGHDKKPIQYPALMAKERPQMFCSSRYHEVHTGHWHTKKESDYRSDEAVGVRVKVLSSLAPADYWHAGKGYVGNIRTAEGILWDKNGGLYRTDSWNVPEGL